MHAWITPWVHAYDRVRDIMHEVYAGERVGFCAARRDGWMNVCVCMYDLLSASILLLT